MIYLENNVFDEALERIRFVYDNHDDVIVSMSGGKDSTVVFNLALMVAHEKGRLPLKVFWLDQEAEWQSTVDYMGSIMRRYRDIFESCEGKLPCVVLKGKTMNDLMASTIRHNRARGKHSVQGMSNIVMEMLMNGASDAQVCMELGLEPEELVRLKYITGYAKLYEKTEYFRAAISNKQAAELAKYKKGDE